MKRDVDCEVKYASNGAVRDVVNRGAGGVDTWMVSGFGDGAVNCVLYVQNGVTEWFLVGPTPFLGHLTTVSRRRGRSVSFCGNAANSTFRLDLASDLSFVPFSFSVELGVFCALLAAQRWWQSEVCRDELVAIGLWVPWRLLAGSQSRVPLPPFC